MVVLTTLQNLTDYLKTTKYEITFIRLTINPVSVNIPNLISNKNITYNKSYEYIDISSSVNGINTFYNTNYNSPILLTFKKIKYGDVKYSQPQPYYTINNNNATEISNYIDCSLEINSMQSFKDHLKYNTYDIRFVRLNKFSSLKSIYIQYLINSLNVLNKSVDYFDLDVEEINNFYVKQNISIITFLNGIRFVTTTFEYNIKALPALLSFKKEQIVNNFIPCRKISGDSIDVINEFLRAGLK